MSWIDRKSDTMAARVKLSAKFQISVPESVRSSQAWRAGQEFVLIPKDGGVLLMPVPRLEDLRGIAGDADPSDYRDRGDRF